jgi:4-amino-4-deoxy-L-arabinose transferase-like glycosyltransferase
VRRLLKLLWGAAVLCVLALYYRHLLADFPSHSPWTGWAKFTDEGWYGDAAIRHALFGRWNLRGDFNPGVALPVLPFFEAIVFHFTGATLAAARALSVTFFAGSLAGIFFLMKRYHSRMAAGVAITLLVLSPFNFAFMRLAILEPPLLFFSVLLLLACSHAHWRQWIALLAAGILLVTLALTKTSGLALAPAAMYLVWRANHRDVGRWLRSLVVIGGVAVGLAAAYAALIVATHHTADFRYFFVANARPPMTLHSHWDAVRGALADGMWADRWLYPAACAVVVMAALWLRRMGRDPLFGACVWWMAGTLAFLAWHANLQPRYYAALLPAIIMLPCIVLEHAWRSRKRVLSAVILIVMAAAALHDARLTLRWARHPEYTNRNAAHSLVQVVRADP